LDILLVDNLFLAYYFALSLEFTFRCKFLYADTTLL